MGKKLLGFRGQIIVDLFILKVYFFCCYGLSIRAKTSLRCEEEKSRRVLER
ncbi:hypothetical protein [Paenibacillus pedocola]|uniref:hypothetical protein n=1 Tax=Paenibacillus pedocola TaxID=3242193 RepID=UPI0028780CD5|nr:hypothetical protein [Paenibacillus typhae]